MKESCVAKLRQVSSHNSSAEEADSDFCDEDGKNEESEGKFPMNKVMLITKCPHPNRKHYAKVSFGCHNPFEEHVLKLLQEIWKKPICKQVRAHRSTSLFNGDVPNLLFS